MLFRVIGFWGGYPAKGEAASCYLVEGHLTAGEAGRLAVRAQVGFVLLTHLPHYGDHQELILQSLEGARMELESQKNGKYSSEISAISGEYSGLPRIELAREGHCWEDKV
jgi:ribonuclease BN (tRNA processing enzyme)